jgi:hypothetical protein
MTRVGFGLKDAADFTHYASTQGANRVGAVVWQPTQFLLRAKRVSFPQPPGA